MALLEQIFNLQSLSNDTPRHFTFRASVPLVPEEPSLESTTVAE